MEEKKSKKDTCECSYDDLLQKYDHFMAPAMAVYSGKDNVVTKKGAMVEDVRITLSVAAAASLSFRVVNAFDPETKKINQDIKEALSLGTTLEAKLGYGAESELTTVFKGYVAEVRTSYQEAPVLSVTAMDLRKLMMENKRDKFEYEEKSYSKIFEAVIQNYESLYSECCVDEISGNQTEKLIQKGSDYDFVKNLLCRRGGREFFMVGGKVCFQKPASKEELLIELEWNKNLMSFEKGSRYYNEQIKVYSSQENKTGNVVSDQIKTEEGVPDILSGVIVQEHEAASGMDEETLNNLLQKLKEDKERKNKIASGSLIGLPELVPGRYIKITGVDPADEGVYYVSEVQHSFGRDGFTTSFSVGESGGEWLGQKESGEENKVKGVMRAVVKENWNQDQPGWVKVEFLTGEEGKKTTDWIPVAQSYCGSGYGACFVPEIDAEVLVESRTGDINDLVVTGTIWNQEDQPPEKTLTEKNTVKKILTKGKHEILFDDDADAGSLRVSTANGLQMLMTEKEKTVTLSDAEGKNFVKLDGENGIVEIKAEKKLVLSVGGKEMVTLEKTGNKLALHADHITQKGDQDMKLETQKLSAKGSITELKAEGSFKINSSGITEIKGTMVKIN